MLLWLGAQRAFAQRTLQTSLLALRRRCCSSDTGIKTLYQPQAVENPVKKRGCSSGRNKTFRTFRLWNIYIQMKQIYCEKRKLHTIPKRQEKSALWWKTPWRAPWKVPWKVPWRAPWRAPWRQNSLYSQTDATLRDPLRLTADIDDVDKKPFHFISWYSSLFTSIENFENHIIEI